MHQNLYLRITHAVTCGSCALKSVVTDNGSTLLYLKGRGKGGGQTLLPLRKAHKWSIDSYRHVFHKQW